MKRLLLALLFLLPVPAWATYPCGDGQESQLSETVETSGSVSRSQVCVAEPTPTPIPWNSSWSQWLPTPAPTLAPPTPQPTFAYVAPTPATFPTSVPTPLVPTPAPTLSYPTPQPTYAYAAPTPMPTYAYTAPTPVPTVAQLSAVYDPASLAASTSLCESVTVTGVVTGKNVQWNAGVAPATGCVIASVRASASNTVEVCWRNTFAATTACNTASSTWLFKQP